jgi:hypothetical protein
VWIQPVPFSDGPRLGIQVEGIAFSLGGLQQLKRACVSRVVGRKQRRLSRELHVQLAEQLTPRLQPCNRQFRMQREFTNLVFARIGILIDR